MLRLFLLLSAFTLVPLSAGASEWTGSLEFTKGFVGQTASWRASLNNNGKGVFKVKNTDLRYRVEKSNSFFIVSQKGGGVIGTGIVKKGHVVGIFQAGKAFAGHFEGNRTRKGGGKK